MALCLSGESVETAEQIVKMAAVLKFSLISNLHGTALLTTDTPFTINGPLWGLEVGDHSDVVLYPFSREGKQS